MGITSSSIDARSVLSSKNEEMLRRGEASRDQAAAYLVQEYYAPLYRLAVAMLDDADAGVFTAVETLVHLVMRSNQFHGETSVQEWVFRMGLDQCRSEYRRLKRLRWWKSAIPFTRKPVDFGISTPETYMDAELWLAFDKTDEPDRSVGILHYVLGWEFGEIGAVLNLSEVETARALKALRRRFQAVLEPFALGEDALLPDPFDERLRDSFQRRWPAINPSETDIGEIRAIVMQQVGHRSQS